MPPIEYNIGTPTESGVYACRLPLYGTNGLHEDKFLTWAEGRWCYPGSDQGYRGEVTGWIGPLQRRMKPKVTADTLERREDMLRHMLGAEPGRYSEDKWGFRNHWCASRNSEDYAELCAMVESGLVTRDAETEGFVVFRATEAGCNFIGLTREQIKRAFEC